ncbi:MAG: insulinase family protein, partial [Deltaproteobacteria bacterium]|nr:insulinase family protein [Deltaproteobacteria bacterium]
EGSRSFPPGSLIPFFQKNGMSFGGDTNAFTSYAATVYTLDLATGSLENLKQGLLALRDFADGVSFGEQEVEQERGVILAEKTMRDSEQFRAIRRYMAAMFPDSRFANMPIGEETAIRAATSGPLRAFYRTWYRPERMILVAAGSLDPAVLEPLIREAFADMTPEEPARATSPWGAPEHRGIRAFYDQRDLGRTTVSLTSMGPRRHESDSLASRKETLLATLSAQMMLRRLQQREQADSTLWSGADVDMERAFGLFPTASLQAFTTAEGWEPALRVLEQELRQALDTGFTEDELQENLAELAALLEQDVRERPNLTNSSVALSVVAACNRDRVFTSPEQDLDLHRTISAGLDPEAVNAFFRQAWDKGNRILYVNGNAAIPEKERAVLAAYEASLAVPLPERAEAVPEPFPYLPLPQAENPLPVPAERSLNEGRLRVLSGRFANGATFQLVPSTLSQDQVAVHLWFGRGLNALPEEQTPAARLAEAVLGRNGPGKLTRLESSRRFDKFSLNVNESFRDNFFSITGNAPKEHLELLLQAVWTQFTDPTPHPSALEEVRRDLALNRHNRYNTVPGVLRDEQRAFFSGPAARKRALTEAEAGRLNLEDVKAAIAASRQTPVRHLIVIGDFDPQAALPGIQTLFGTAPLPAEPEPDPRLTPPLPAAFPAGQTRSLRVPDTVNKAVIMAAWRRDMPPDTPKRPDLIRQMLAEALNEQLRDTLRQKLGITYSPWADYQVAEVGTGFAMYRAMISTDVAQCEAARKALDEVMADLARNGVNADQLERIRPPLLTGWKTARGTNSYWLSLLLREYLTGQPHADWNDAIPELIGSVTKADLDAEAAAAFAPAGCATLLVIQDPQAEKR